jgi:putative membrane protein
VLLVVGLAAWYFEATSREASRATGRQRLAFLGGLLALLVALSWPIDDLATSVSLLAVIAQRQLLILAAAPLLLLGTPSAVVGRLTRPAPIDWLASRLARPVPALVTTTVVLAATAIPPSVDAATASPPLRAVVLLAIFAAGLVLWLPVIDRVPGVPRLRPLAKGGYLVAQALAPTFLSFVWIFALHPLYHSLQGQQRLLDLSPLADQQLSGYLAKLGTFGVLLTVAYVIFVRADDTEDESSAPLHWSDVERALERAERRERGTGAPSEPD